jgi:hypothetical protein
MNATTQTSSAPSARVTRPWSGGRTTLVVLGLLSALFGATVLVGSGFAALAWQHRDSAGYFTSGHAALTSRAYAVTAPDLTVDVRGPDAVTAGRLLGRVRLEVRGTGEGRPLFVGIGPADRVADYLATVGHSEIRDLQVDPVSVSYRELPGAGPATPPAQQPLWVRSVSGDGPLSLNWSAQAGDWSVVIMNADGSAAVDADVRLAGTLPAVGWAALVLLIVGIWLLAGGLILVALAFGTRHHVRRPADGMVP